MERMNQPEKNDTDIQNTLGQNLFNAYVDLVSGGDAFSKINTNGDKFLSEEELQSFLDNALTNPNPTFAEQSEIQAARHMKDHPEIRDVSNDPGWDSTGITMADLEKQFRIAAASEMDDVYSRIEGTPGHKSEAPANVQLPDGRGLTVAGVGTENVTAVTGKFDSGDDTFTLVINDPYRGHTTQFDYVEGSVGFVSNYGTSVDVRGYRQTDSQ